ncbi:MAG: KH domain-containing protein [Candidatus Acidiferrales bacterium]
MKDLVESIAKALVDHPEHVQVRAVEGEQLTVFELRVHPDDLGKAIRATGADGGSHPVASCRGRDETGEALHARNS